MKVIFGQFNTFKTGFVGSILAIFWIAGLILSSCFLVHAQSNPKEKNRTKDFGKSLDKYKKKSVESADKVKKSDVPNDDVIRVETNMVVSDVLVVNQKGNALLGLKKEDFIVTENGVSQDLELFSSEGKTDVPRSIVLILELGYLRPIAQRSLEAAKKLVDKLGPKDRMAIVTADIKLITDFTDDKNLLKSKLGSLKKPKWAGVDIYNYSTLLAVLNELFTADDKRPIVIQQSLGGEWRYLKEAWKRAGVKYPTTGHPFDKAFDFSDVVEAVEKSRATIYTVIPAPRFVGLPHTEQVARAHLFLDPYLDTTYPNGELVYRNGEQVYPNGELVHPNGELKNAESRRAWVENQVIASRVAHESALITVTHPSGGYTDYLEKPDDADEIYNRILKVIDNRYVIGYYSKNETRDGRRRTVKIEVRGHPEYTILGRKTYFAPQQ